MLSNTMGGGQIRGGWNLREEEGTLGGSAMKRKLRGLGKFSVMSLHSPLCPEDTSRKADIFFKSFRIGFAFLSEEV